MVREHRTGVRVHRGCVRKQRRADGWWGDPHAHPPIHAPLHAGARIRRVPRKRAGGVKMKSAARVARGSRPQIRGAAGEWVSHKSSSLVAEIAPTPSEAQHKLLGAGRGCGRVSCCGRLCKLNARACTDACCCCTKCNTSCA